MGKIIAMTPVRSIRGKISKSDDLFFSERYGQTVITRVVNPYRGPSTAKQQSVRSFGVFRNRCKLSCPMRPVWPSGRPCSNGRRSTAHCVAWCSPSCTNRRNPPPSEGSSKGAYELLIVC